LLGIVGQAQQTKVQGYLKGFSQSKIYLNLYKGETIARDSAEVINGSFTFLVNVTEATAARLVTKDISKKIFDKENNFYFPALQLLFFIEPQKNVIIRGDYSDWPVAAIKGGTSNAKLTQYYLSGKPGLLSARKAMAEAYHQKNAGDLNGFKEKERLYLDLETINNKSFDQVIRQNSHSILAAFNIYEALAFMNDERQLQALYNKFDPASRNHSYGKSIYRRLTDLKESAVGTMVKKFIVTGKDSNVNIESFLGKYVLLDFWGSWCAPCREGHPHLRELYAKYRDKGFDIIAIADERSENPKQSWLEAIAKDSLPWVHILNNEANRKDKTDLIKLFAVKSYPTKILIDPEGKIILKPQYGTDQLEKALAGYLDE
jgi:thiol-disulfide isomerase/thioredoxin